MNSRAKREADARHSERRSRLGYALEDAVAELLDKMIREGIIEGFVKHPHNSREDREGKDFTVWVAKAGIKIEKSFGVSISIRRAVYSRLKHPEVYDFCFPVETKPETMRKRILSLFESP